MDFLNASVTPQGAIQVKYNEPTTGSSTWKYFTGGSSLGVLKACTAIASDFELAASVSSAANDVISSVIAPDALHGAVGKLAGAAALSAIPMAMENTRKACCSAVQLVSNPTVENAGRFAIDAVKTGKEGCEVACGFGVAGAKLPKSALSCIADIHGLYGSVQERISLDPAAPIKAHVPGYHDAYVNAVDTKIVKNMTALMFHGIGFITGFFALVISPYWSAAFGMLYLIAGVVAFVYAAQAENVEETNTLNALVSRGCVKI